MFRLQTVSCLLWLATLCLVQLRHVETLHFEQTQAESLASFANRQKRQFSSNSKLNSIYLEDRTNFTRAAKLALAARNISLGNEREYDDQGEWSEWSAPSQCTRRCDGGISYQTRICLQTGNCKGPYKRYILCNTEDCDLNEPSFQEQQCARLDSKLLNGQQYNWTSIDQVESCTITCVPKNGNQNMRQTLKAQDGTRCYNDGSLDTCIEGMCLPVGCDRQLGSYKMNDKCGVCGGKGDSCLLKHGTFLNNQLTPGHYNKLFEIPAGAKNIRITEQVATRNFLALSNRKGLYCLNGQWKIEFSRLFKFGGSVFRYIREKEQEFIYSNGPINEPLVVELLYNDKNKGISWEYTIDNKENELIENELENSINVAKSTDPRLLAATEAMNSGRYIWWTGGWTRCSRRCGGGYQQRRVLCVQRTASAPHDKKDVHESTGPASEDALPSYLQPSKDENCDPRRQPMAVQSCNVHVCPPSWLVGSWGQCLCDLGVRLRSVQCRKGAIHPDTGRPVPEQWLLADDQECEQTRGNKRTPIKIQKCDPNPDNCLKSESPSGAVETELDNDKKKSDLDEIIDELIARSPEKNCTIKHPYVWKTGNWSECDSRCGMGQQNRTIQCVDIDNENGSPLSDFYCRHTSKPASEQICFVKPCTGVDWVVSEWSECSSAPLPVYDIDLMQGDEPTNSEVSTEAVGESADIVPNEPNKPTENTTVGDLVTQSTTIQSTEAKDELVASEGSVISTTVSSVTTDKNPTDEQILTTVSNFENEASSTAFTPTTSIPTTFSSVSTASSDSNPTTISVLSTTESSIKSVATTVETIAPVLKATVVKESPLTRKPTIQIRSVRCVDIFGHEYSESWCGRHRKPAERRTCSQKSSLPFWFTSEWSECSADTCGKGIKTRHVVCARLNNNNIEKVSEIECSNTEKPNTEEPCTAAKVKCNQLQFITPWSTCAQSCDTTRQRSVICFAENKPTVCQQQSSIILQQKCSEAKEQNYVDEFNRKTTCSSSTNQENECEKSTFGCCPDKQTPANGTNYAGCPPLKVNDCASSEFGCCRDNISAAFGPFQQGCPIACGDTRFGCCADNSTTALDENEGGCPKPSTIAPEILNNGVTSTLSTPKEEEEYEIVCELASSNVVTTDTSNIVVTENNENVSTTSTDLIEESSGDDEILNVSTVGPVCFRKLKQKKNSCQKSKFGCCPDGKTLKLDESNAGCLTLENELTSCTQTEFGCCQDNKTTAIGPNFEGCSTVLLRTKLNCTATEWGCCQDGQTPASGTDYAGCEGCAATQFGCCADRQTPATGPNMTGCSCATTSYGCCPDGLTPATGANFEGCNNCNTSRFGCCEDGKTSARGILADNQLDCPCEASKFGCCPDRIHKATGENYEGCPCSSLPHGCCPDGQTPATGSRFAGCDCNKSPFGCCADGSSVAYGPNGLGCSEGSRLDTQWSAGVCGLTPEKGPCRNFTVRWHFDSNYGGCTRFWYGGCEGNGNNFLTQYDCERDCVQPTGDASCSLPLAKGSCNATQQVWGYDISRHVCVPFNYGGCLGNHNRFESREQCERTCYYAQKEDPCEQPLEVGRCDKTLERFYFNSNTGVCEPFLYTGCSGNRNNFYNENECRSRCGTRTNRERCLQPVAAGNCLGRLHRYYFDHNSGICRTFTYTGCDGNANRFVDRSSCEKTCNGTSVHLTGISSPVYPASSYSGIAHHSPNSDDTINRLTNALKELTRLQKGNQASLETLQKNCGQYKDPGGCDKSEQKYWFNPQANQCQSFIYSGCGGNQNRFESYMECESRCVRQFQKLLSNQRHLIYRQRILKENLAAETRSNQAASASPIARAEDDRQSSIVRTNNTNLQEFKPEHCALQYDSGHCNGNQLYFYYDHKDGICKNFYYTGCGGNANRFKSQSECAQKCWATQDICQLPVSAGSCIRQFAQWYYDSKQGRCQEFNYTGCNGNANRFNSKEDCDRQCYRSSSTSNLPTSFESESTGVDLYKKTEDICLLPYRSGNCKEYNLLYYYDTRSESCRQFVYTGCDGNANQFPTRTACEQRCSSASDESEPVLNVDKPEEVCVLSVDVGECRSIKARWYYDQNEFTCRSFEYNGCKGNRNRFLTYDSCINFCKNVRPSAMNAQIFGQSAGLTPVSSNNSSSNANEPFDPFSVGLSSIAPPPPALPDNPNGPNCPVDKCDASKCYFGIDQYVDANGCHRCRCHHPCNVHRCPADERCAVEVYRTQDGKPRTTPLCRKINKPGQCPPVPIVSPPPEECVQRCRLDSDCRSVDKCCSNGCAKVCIPAIVESYANQSLFSSNIGSAPITTTSTDNSQPLEIKVKLSEHFRLDCDQVSASRELPVTWSRDGIELKTLFPNRVQMYSNGSVLIAKAVKSDVGHYQCVYVVPEVGNQVTHIRAVTVYAPAEITTGTEQVIGQLDKPVELPCKVIGEPKPTVTWWKDTLMLPLTDFSSNPNWEYRKGPNNELIIRKMTLDHQGTYTCQAQNIHGPIQLKDINLSLDFSSHVKVKPSGHVTDEIALHSGSFSPSNAAFNAVNSHSLPLPPFPEIPPIPPVPFISTPFNEPVSVQLKLVTEYYKVGSYLQLDCSARGQPLPSIDWYFNKEPVATSPALGRFRVNPDWTVNLLSNNSLTIQSLTKQHSGTYTCRASNVNSEDRMSMDISVEDISIPPNCVDNSHFGDCSRVVANRFCSNRSYQRLCCRSCLLDNQITMKQAKVIHFG